MLDANGTLKLAATASGAFERRFLGDVCAQQRRFAAWSKFFEIAAQAQDNLFRVEHLAGIVGGAMLGAAAALHAGEGLQRVDARDIFACIESEIIVAGERRNTAEACPPQEHRY